MADAYRSMLAATGNVVAAPDLHNDRTPDLLFESPDTGILTAWALNGATEYASGFGALSLPVGYVADPAWQVKAVADMNGDGYPDYLWQNQSSGYVVVYYMQGTTYLGYSYLGPNGLSSPSTAPGYLVGTGDFNSDTHPDLVFQNGTNGAITIEYFNQYNYIGYATLTGTPSTLSYSGYPIVGVADFNADGHPDLLYQASPANGNQAFIWYLHNNAYLGYANLNFPMSTGVSGIPSGWRVRALANFNPGSGTGQDVYPDMVLQNVGTASNGSDATGELGVWYLSNYTFLGGSAISP